MRGVARLAAIFGARPRGALDASETDGDPLRMARAREAARAEIDVFVAVHEASVFAPAKCAALIRAWSALASMEAVGWRAISHAPPPMPLVLFDAPDAFVASVLSCARSDPWSDVAAPTDRQLDEQCRVLRRAFVDLDRRARPSRASRPPWLALRRTSVVALVGVLAAASVGFAFYRPRWRASYYANDALSGEPSLVSRASEADHYWGRGGPGIALPTDHFSARFETCLVTVRPVTGVFTVGSDDGSRLFVDDREVIDAWADQPYTERSQSVALDAGAHPLRLEYYERVGQARLTFAGRIDGSGTDITGMLRAPKGDGPACGR